MDQRFKGTLPLPTVSVQSELCPPFELVFYIKSEAATPYAKLHIHVPYNGKVTEY